MSKPLITQQDIITALGQKIPAKYNIPIYDNYPSNNENVGYGIYVSAVDARVRIPNQLGVTFCGSFYDVEDSFEINFVSYQDDPYVSDVNQWISELVTQAVNGTQLMDGYHIRTYEHEEVYGATNAERHVWRFTMTRLDFNT